MRKTDRQKLLEVTRGKPIREIVEEKLEEHRGKSQHAARAAVDLEISTSTFHKWATGMGIDLKAYGPEDEEILAGAVK